MKPILDKQNGKGGASDLKMMLNIADLSTKPTYNSKEVCRLLSISYRTFQRMCSDYEVLNGQPKPGTMKSNKIRGQRRVSYSELERFLKDL